MLGDAHNRHTAAAGLLRLATSLKNGETPIGQLHDELKNTKIDLTTNGSYQPAHTGQWNRVSLLQFIQDHGWTIPATREELVNLATALSTPTPKAARYGDLGGALSWPVPLDKHNQQQLKDDIQAGKFGAINAAPFKNPFEYLLGGRSLTPEELSNPQRLIDSLIESPKGKALGAAIQSAFEAREVKGSLYDWLLAALSLTTDGADSEGVAIEGYRLVSAENAGKTASAIVTALADHLVASGKASSPELAKVQAHILLASRAPEFLVKGIPDQVTPGNHSWVSFTTAVGRIEAKAPGATATMSYAQVMLHASIAPINEQDSHIEQTAQSAALKDWYFANGNQYPSSDTAMAEVRKAFNAQISELKEAAQTQIGEMPTTKDIALEQLKKALPEMDPKLFEEKTITLQPSSRYFPGPYSILDMFIDGRGLHAAPNSADDWGTFGRGFVNVATLGQVEIPKDGVPGKWVSSSAAINVQAVGEKLKNLPRPSALFDEAFKNYSDAVKKTTSAQLKHGGCRG